MSEIEYIFKAYLWVYSFPASIENNYYPGWIYHPYSVKKWLVEGFKYKIVEVTLWEGDIPVLTEKGLNMVRKEFGEEFYKKLRSMALQKAYLEQPGEDITSLYLEEGLTILNNPELNIRRIILCEYMNYYYEDISDLFNLLVNLKTTAPNTIYNAWLNLLNMIYEHIRDGAQINKEKICVDQNISEFLEAVKKYTSCKHIKLFKTLEQALRKGVIEEWFNGRRVLRNPFTTYGLKLPGSLDIFSNLEEWGLANTLTGRHITKQDIEKISKQALKNGWTGLDRVIRQWHHEGETKFKHITLEELIKII